MRQLRGMEIIARGGQVRCVADREYLVCSQHGNGWYKVMRNSRGWLCECPDHLKRHEPCKHIHAVIFLLRLPEVMSTNTE